ncbi:MAG: DUF3769 domain-containing protein, partial [Planctomycetia bacterium]|nr:DUF3769 domain-containing protein [Planctomycetia bacterium]
MTSSSSSGYDERGYDHSTDRGVDTPRSPHPSVGWATTVFLLLGMVGLILLAISPLLPGHTALADGEFARVLNQSSIPAVVPDSLLIAVSVPLFALVLPLAVLWTSAIYQRPTLLGRLLCFSCVAFSSLSAFVAGCHYGDQVVWLRQLHILTESGKSAGWSGDVVFQRSLSAERRYGFPSVMAIPDEVNQFGGTRPSQLNNLATASNSPLVQGTISRWRVQSGRLRFNANTLIADRMAFSNDPFTPAQAWMDSEDVVATLQPNGD